MCATGGSLFDGDFVHSSRALMRIRGEAEPDNPEGRPRKAERLSQRQVVQRIEGSFDVG